MTVPTFAPARASVRRVSSSMATTARSSAAAGAKVMPRTIRDGLTAAVTVLVAIALLLPIGAVLQIVLVSQIDDRTRTQAIVVLDPARYWGDPVPVLQARLDHAAALYREGVAPVVVLTGPQRSQALARTELLARGVPADDVVSFVTGTDTVGSLRVVAGVMRDLGWSAATVVTDPAHAARAAATASGLGIDAHMSPTESGPGTALTSEYVGRETVALLRYYLVTRLSISPIVKAT